MVVSDSEALFYKIQVAIELSTLLIYGDGSS